MKKNRGFSLFELLIVVGIILIIAAIAIPSLLRYRKAANESRAVANLRIISTAQVTYQSWASGNYGTIAGLQADGFVHPVWPTFDRLIWPTPSVSRFSW